MSIGTNRKLGGQIRLAAQLGWRPIEHGVLVRGARVLVRDARVLDLVRGARILVLGARVLDQVTIGHHCAKQYPTLLGTIGQNDTHASLGLTEQFTCMNEHLTSFFLEFSRQIQTLTRLYTYAAYFMLVVSCLVYSTQMMAGKHAREDKMWRSILVADVLFVLMGLTNTHKFIYFKTSRRSSS